MDKRNSKIDFGWVAFPENSIPVTQDSLKDMSKQLERTHHKEYSLGGYKPVE